MYSPVRIILRLAVSLHFLSYSSCIFTVKECFEQYDKETTHAILTNIVYSLHLLGVVFYLYELRHLPEHCEFRQIPAHLGVSYLYTLRHLLALNGSQ